MPAWLELMAHSLRPLLYAGLVFTVPLTLASFGIGLALAFVVALVRLFGPKWAIAIVRFTCGSFGARRCSCNCS